MKDFIELVLILVYLFIFMWLLAGFDIGQPMKTSHEIPEHLQYEYSK